MADPDGAARRRGPRPAPPPNSSKASPRSPTAPSKARSGSGEQTRRILELLQQQTTLVERSITESAQFATDTMDRVTAALEKLERVSEELATAQDKLGAFTEQSSNTLRRAVDEFTALSDELAFFIKTVQHDVTRRRNEELVGGREEDSWS